ncbi:hypothetical protein G7Y89_g11690 [Cudoniella acicularis]|uniref:NmrA-like domain-containing protein n=1 Tax=Cudoniella acicularis TaxID=354080 RepID=A0A8H4VXS7_9HELO|nr:hypothetical protein G7Y89_g11690 [Cudoniella acicularis]
MRRKLESSDGKLTHTEPKYERHPVVFMANECRASGRLGPWILKALQADPTFDITVVTRYTSAAEFPPNTKVVKVTDGYPIAEMIEVFKGQDAVILSLGYAAEHLHASLAEASIKAGVKRLIASVWGGNDTNKEAPKIFPIAAGKAKLFRELRAMETPGWSWTAICNGLFFDFCVTMGFFRCFDPEAHTAQIWDSGNVKFSGTNMATIGLSVAKTLAKPEETANRSVYISSFECSMNDILESYKKATGVSNWDIVHVNSDVQIKKATEAMISGSGDRMVAMGNLALASLAKEGMGADFAAEGLLDNDLLGIPRETVDETVARVLKDGL